MDDLSKDAQRIKSDIIEACKKLSIDDLDKKLNDLKKLSQSKDFWKDSARAQSDMIEISKLENKVNPWIKIRNSINETLELAQLNDESLSNEISSQLDKISSKFNKLKLELKFSGPYDDHDAIISIFAGAGGTDAQDWTQILFRMYSRYFENNRWNIKIIDESPGEEAGLKSITVEVVGTNVYGKLRGEQGVHRLVRLSPFNSDNLRQTSFAKVEVIPKINKPEELEIDEKELKIDVFRSGGHGGQSVNTTDSAVRVTHIPTGITVSIQNERSQLQNKETAMTILRSKLAQLQIEQHTEKIDELKGPNQSAEWGNQIRSYVLHPYKQVKDLRTKYETSDPDSVLNGKLDDLINAYLEHTISENQ